MAGFEGNRYRDVASVLTLTIAKPKSLLGWMDTARYNRGRKKNPTMMDINTFWVFIFSYVAVITVTEESIFCSF